MKLRTMFLRQCWEKLIAGSRWLVDFAKVHPLLDALTLMLLTWGLLQFHDTTLNDPIDLIVVLLIGLTYSISGLVMLLGTKRWSARSMGLFLTAIGNATLWNSAAYNRLIQPNNPSVPEPVLDLVRACYLVGGPLVLFGLGAWVVVKWWPDPDTRLSITFPAPEAEDQRSEPTPQGEEP